MADSHEALSGYDKCVPPAPGSEGLTETPLQRWLRIGYESTCALPSKQLVAASKRKIHTEITTAIGGLIEQRQRELNSMEMPHSTSGETTTDPRVPISIGSAVEKFLVDAAALHGEIQPDPLAEELARGGRKARFAQKPPPLAPEFTSDLRDQLLERHQEPTNQS